VSKPADIRVAIVDDDESLCRSLCRFLDAAGLNAVSYLSAEAYLADDQRGRFDCLILDVQLDGMSGIELASRLCASGATTPIIFITAHDHPELQERAVTIPGAVYLRKTDSGDTVLAAIRRVIREPVAAVESSRVPMSFRSNDGKKAVNPKPKNTHE
jgi:FixJ family two-component response regulator